ncbi:hypothetical protein N5923_09870 [Erwiniaceae bacterium BAC15a-03b]|uniref:Uncharacterized protein n=1 Tax=Winslowiella arboricola TaxID=2978220 RepID=A0A9J6PUT4_9GAMM|nr:hypothetical protein [Winslowiella arboricola]MCU5773106.1 hypothetical protein [Winslowiella arboricola]MCU5777799.1 hypothetical protein [Winslowiella arboricola]
MQNGIPASGQRPIPNFSLPTNVQSEQTRGNGLSRTNSSNSTSSTGSVESESQRNISELHNLLRDYFPGGEGMEELMHERATGLDEMGYDRDSAKAVLSKGMKLDDITAAAEGALTTVSFAASGFPAETLSKAANLFFNTTKGSLTSDVIGGVMAGGSAIVLKAYSDKVLANAVKDAKWMVADHDKLEPVMQELVDRREGLGHSMQQALLGGTGFNARNLVTGSAAVGTAMVAEKERLAANTTLGTALTPAAGALSSVVANRNNSLHGPEFLLGRTDWRERFQQLDQTSISGQMVSGTKDRLITAAQDMLTSPRQIAKGLMNPFSGNMVAETMTLAAGLGGVNGLKNLTRAHMQSGTENLASQQAVEQAVNLVTSAGAYALQGIAGTLAGPAPTRNDEAIDHFFDTHPQLDVAKRLWGDNGTTNAPAEEAPPRPGNPVAADLERQSLESAGDSASIVSGESNSIPLQTLSRPGNPVAAQLERESQESLQNSTAPPVSSETLRPPRAGGSNWQTAMAKVGSRDELNALQMQQKFAASTSSRPVKDKPD